MWFVYLICCSDNTLYCGITNDIDKRINKHNSGKGAKYTSGRLPVNLLYIEMVNDKSTALKRECAIKKLTKQQKLNLIESGFNSLNTD